MHGRHRFGDDLFANATTGASPESLQRCGVEGLGFTGFDFRV